MAFLERSAQPQQRVRIARLVTLVVYEIFNYFFGKVTQIKEKHILKLSRYFINDEVVIAQQSTLREAKVQESF